MPGWPQRLQPLVPSSWAHHISATPSAHLSASDTTMRVRLHLNGLAEPVFVLRVPDSWADLVSAARARLQVSSPASCSRPTTRIFMSSDGAEVVDLADLQEGDVIAVDFDGGAYRKPAANEEGGRIRQQLLALSVRESSAPLWSKLEPPL